MKIQIFPEQDKEEFEKKLKVHHDDAEYAYESKKVDKENSKNDQKSKMITFDVQQCLRTPLVQNSVANS